MTPDAERIAPYARLQEMLGSRPADTLVAMIRPRDELATKSYLNVVKEDLRSEMRELSRELRTDMAELRGDLKGEMTEIRVDLRSQARTFVVTQTATVFGVSGLVVATQQLL